MQFHSYGLVIGIAIVVGWWWAGKRADQVGMSRVMIDRGVTWMIVWGVIGARIYHVVDYWNYYVSDPVRGWMVWQGGLGIWGAIVGGLLGGLIWARGRFGLLLQLLDVVAAAMPLSQAIGRWGNWLNGELYGKNGQPLFGYESVLNLLLFWLINFRFKFTKSGQVLGAYLIGYGLIRLGLEQLRVEPWSIAGMPVAAMFSLTAIIIGGILLRGKYGKKI